MLQSPDTKAGPNQRAGFKAAPVIGPTEKIIPVIVNPIGSPGSAAAALRLSTATPNITNIKSEVHKISAIAPELIDVPFAIAGKPKPLESP